MRSLIAPLITLHSLGAQNITLIVIGLFAVVAGIVLPAIWSSKPARRRAALAVIETLGRIIRRT